MTKEEMKVKATPNAVPPIKRSKRATPSKEGRQVLQTLTEDLPVEMSDAEIQQACDELVGQTQELEAHLAHKKEVTSGLKATELSIQARIKNLCIQLKNKSRTEAVSVQVEADFAEGVARFIRLDDGSEVRTRPLAESERQQSIPGTEGELPPGVERIETTDA